MTCHTCAQSTLNLFIRSFAVAEPVFGVGHSRFRPALQVRLFSTAPRPKKRTNADQDSLEHGPTEKPERPSWQVQKEAVKTKLGGEAWNPRKKLSPDTMEGIRHLHKSNPSAFTTPVLASHFKVSPEAIRRILKSNWRPTDDEYEARMQRWDKRGERIWSNLVEMGVKPPKRWRDMGVGRTQNRELPKWKSKHRNRVAVGDSVSGTLGYNEPEEDTIPIVDSSGRSSRTKNAPAHIPLSQRL